MQMKPWLRGVIVTILLVVAAACGHGPSSVAPAPTNRICVTNESIGDYRLRINGRPAGSIYAGESKFIRVSNAEASSGVIRLYAHALGNGGDRWSTRFNMNQFSIWSWGIQNSQVTTLVNLTPGEAIGCD